MVRGAVWMVAMVVLGACRLFAAGDPFLGKWKVDAAKSRLNDEMKVEAAGVNRYTLTFAPGAVDTVAADRTDQRALRGTTLSVEVKGVREWVVIRKMKGRMPLTATWTLSGDGMTLNDDYREIAPDGTVMKMPYVYARTSGEGSDGMGTFIGTWDSESEKVKAGMELAIQGWEGDGLWFSDPEAGLAKKMKFDGKDYPDAKAGADAAGGAGADSGDGGARSSGRRVGARRLEITDKAKGAVTGSWEMELSEDLKTLTVSARLVGENRPRSVLVFGRE